VTLSTDTPKPSAALTLQGDYFVLRDPEWAHPGMVHLSRRWQAVRPVLETFYGPDGEVDHELHGMWEPGPFAGWSIHLPFEKNPLPMNRNGRKGGGWRAQAGVIKTISESARVSVLNRVPPQERIRVGLTWEVVSQRTRDEDNLVLLQKTLVDGIRRGGVVPDDSRVYVERTYPEIHYAPRSLLRPDAFFRFDFSPEQPQITS
jgi:hypothetical protein